LSAEGGDDTPICSRSDEENREHGWSAGREPAEELDVGVFCVWLDPEVAPPPPAVVTGLGWPGVDPQAAAPINIAAMPASTTRRFT
jgi:hypothetical protein